MVSIVRALAGHAVKVGMLWIQSEKRKSESNEQVLYSGVGGLKQKGKLQPFNGTVLVTTDHILFRGKNALYKKIDFAVAKSQVELEVNSRLLGKELLIHHEGQTYTMGVMGSMDKMIAAAMA